MEPYIHGRFTIYHTASFSGDVVVQERRHEGGYAEARVAAMLLLGLVREHMTAPRKATHYELAGIVLGAGGPAVVKLPFRVLLAFVADRYVRLYVKDWLQGANETRRATQTEKVLSDGGK